MTKGQRGRANAKLELGLAGFIIFVLEPFLFIAAPRYMGGPMSGPIGTTGLLITVLPFAAYAAQLIALAWMVRIYRADPEPDQDAWRYRAAR